MNDEMAGRLVQHWVRVLDAHGRERLEARWVRTAHLEARPGTSAAAHAA